MSQIKLTIIVAIAALASLPTRASADMITLASSSDTWIRDGFSHTANGVSAVLDTRLSFVPYVQFNLSALSVDTISNATLRLWKVASARNDTITTARYATYGLPSTAGDTAQNWHETLDFDPLDATAGLDFRNVGLEHMLNSTATNGVDRTRLVSLDPEDGGVAVTETLNNTTGSIVITGADLVAFLNTRADDNGLVTFVLPIEDATRGWGIASKENANAALQPALELEFTTLTVPEPTAAGAAAIALLALVAGRRRR